MCTRASHSSPLDVAITAAVGVSWLELRPFVKSFRHFAPCAQLVVLVSESPPTEVDVRLREHRVEQLRLSRTWPFVKPDEVPEISTAMLQQLIPAGLSVSTDGQRVPGRSGLVLARYFIADAWLAARQAESVKNDRANLALLVDSVDVIFQADPFANAARELRDRTSQIWAFEEHPTRKIRNCAFNRAGLKPFGTRTLARLQNQTVVNSGVVLGTTFAVRKLISSMRVAVEILQGYELNDQGILNVIARFAPPLQQFAGLDIIPFGRGLVRNVGIELVASMGHYNLSSVRLGRDAQGWPQVLGERSHPAPIVHQYDRSNVLQVFLRERWAVAEDAFAGKESDAPLRAIWTHRRPASVADLEFVLAKADNFYAARACPSKVGCCRQRWLWRRHAFMQLSGMNMANLPWVLKAEHNCQNVLSSVHVAFSFNMVAIRTRLSKEHKLHRRFLQLLSSVLHSSSSAAAEVRNCEVASLLRRRVGEVRKMPFCAMPFQACLDAACGSGQTTPGERADLLWEVLFQSLRETALQENFMLPATIQQVSPLANETWVREISWAGGSDQIHEEANSSSIVSRLRLLHLSDGD